MNKQVRAVSSLLWLLAEAEPGTSAGCRECRQVSCLLPALDGSPARVRGEGCERGPQATRRGREHGKEPGGKAIFTASDLGQLWADTAKRFADSAILSHLQNDLREITGSGSFL